MISFNENDFLHASNGFTHTFKRLKTKVKMRLAQWDVRWGSQPQQPKLLISNSVFDHSHYWECPNFLTIVLAIDLDTLRCQQVATVKIPMNRYYSLNNSEKCIFLFLYYSYRGTIYYYRFLLCIQHHYNFFCKVLIVSFSFYISTNLY